VAVGILANRASATRSPLPALLFGIRKGGEKLAGDERSDTPGNFRIRTQYKMRDCCEAEKRSKMLKRIGRWMRDMGWNQIRVKPKADTFKTRPTLLSKVRRGDEEGWTQFYELYSDFIRSAGRAAGLSHEESQDLVQETMITVRNYIDGFVPDRNRGRFRTWLRKIVQSRIADQYRKKKRNPLERVVGRSSSADSETSTTARIPNLNEVELDRLIDGKLEQAILTEARRVAREKVRAEDYQAYDLFEVRELSAREAAAVLGISPVTVRVRTFRVRRMVARQARRILKMLERPNWSG
jgi:RNA polymerase sigma factor (sigma-70 family)